VYRIAQEAVTNARRHARGATRIDVKVSIAGERVRLTVHDDGAAGSAGEPGYGITGMTERAELLGGTCSAGRDPEGGWTVTAELPVTGAG
jgi:signal transduction histidine kinase